MKKTTRTERDAAIAAVTNDLLKSKFATEIGQKARVDRSSIQSEHMDQLREVLSDVGRDLSEKGVAPKGMEYMGSLSVHVYRSVILGQAAFVTLSATERLGPDLADGALRELTGTTMANYGRERKKLRSGF